MDTRQFFMHVVRMRHNETCWYSTHDHTALNNSKRLEQECDNEIVQSCVRDAEMEQFVRREYPELIPAINKYKQELATPDLFGNIHHS